MRQKAASSLTLQQCHVKKWQIPRFINTDKAPAYGRALALLKREGRCPSDVEHRQIK
ncbi:DDE-type integrase/transposase/recombinase, partial [Escherichia coli]|uniref:DDE-type integrase/transposase/recombinase n=1 Tax=Escherichia coli TaxID=562 RepID=UPI0035CB1FA3